MMAEPREVAGRCASARWQLVGASVAIARGGRSGRLEHQVPNFQKVEGGADELHEPSDAVATSVASSPIAAGMLQPAVDGFDHSAANEADGVARMSGRPRVDRRTSPPWLDVLGDMRRDVPLPQLPDEGFGVVGLVRGEGDSASTRIG